MLSQDRVTGTITFTNSISTPVLKLEYFYMVIIGLEFESPVKCTRALKVIFTVLGSCRQRS